MCCNNCKLPFIFFVDFANNLINHELLFEWLFVRLLLLDFLFLLRWPRKQQCHSDEQNCNVQQLQNSSPRVGAPVPVGISLPVRIAQHSALSPVRLRAHSPPSSCVRSRSRAPSCRIWLLPSRRVEPCAPCSCKQPTTDSRALSVRSYKFKMKLNVWDVVDVRWKGQPGGANLLSHFFITKCVQLHLLHVLCERLLPLQLFLLDFFVSRSLEI